MMKKNIILVFLFSMFVFIIGAKIGYSIDLKNYTQTSFLTALSTNLEISNFDFLKNITNKETSTYKSLLYSVFFIFICVATYFTRDKKDYSKKGVEHGSASFGKLEDYLFLADKKGKNNMILSQNIKMDMNGRKTRRNMNICVIGGSGSGKTRFFIKPNMMEMNCSYVITDPKGELLKSTGKMLEENGYKVKVLDLVEMNKSSCYNPFKYIRDGADEEVMSLIDTIILNTNGDKKTGGDPFWEKSEMLLLQAIFYYILEVGKEEEKNLSVVMELLSLIDVDLEDTNYKNVLDEMFLELEEEQPNHIAVTQYKTFKLAPPQTALSIAISVGARLSVFNISQVRELTNIDELELEKMGEEKTALFLIISPSDTTFNFIGAMMYSQLFKVLDYSANRLHGGFLPITVRFLLDEFANIGKIPNFEKIYAYARSLNVGICPVFQSLSQLEEMYPKSFETIIDSSDTVLMLGAKGNKSLEYFVKMLGKMTIDLRTHNKSKGRNASYSENNSILGRDLMTATEIQEMDVNDCLVFIKGLKPFKDKKFNILKHKNYKKLSDYKDENIYLQKEREKTVTSTNSIITSKKGTLITKDAETDTEKILNEIDKLLD